MKVHVRVYKEANGTYHVIARRQDGRTIRKTCRSAIECTAARLDALAILEVLPPMRRSA